MLKTLESTYLNNYTSHTYLEMLKRSHAEFIRYIDTTKFSGSEFEEYIRMMDEVSWEFEHEDDNGRGDIYIEAQQSLDNRKVGMTKLLQMFSSDRTNTPGPECVILDALAGDGTIAKFVKGWLPFGPTILSSDISKFMVEQCLKQGIPSVRQSATQLVLNDETMDGVLLAYGTHHIPEGLRQYAVSEGYRVLKNGGRMVLHDFESGGPVDAWFQDVVHHYSNTGHDHAHFSKSGMLKYFRESGFTDVEVKTISDPFFLKGSSPSQAKKNMLMHLKNMYGLEKLRLDTDYDLKKFEIMVENTLGTIEVEVCGQSANATLERLSLVCSGTK